jgi:hypothetical protein
MYLQIVGCGYAFMLIRCAVKLNCSESLMKIIFTSLNQSLVYYLRVKVSVKNCEGLDC